MHMHMHICVGTCVIATILSDAYIYMCMIHVQVPAHTPSTCMSAAVSCSFKAFPNTNIQVTYPQTWVYISQWLQQEPLQLQQV